MNEIYRQGLKYTDKPRKCRWRLRAKSVKRNAIKQTSFEPLAVGLEEMMDVLNTIKQALKTSASVIQWGAGLQESTRKALVTELQGICSNCEAAYDSVLARLVPIKNAYTDPRNLSRELRAFAGNPASRREFKPEHLCGQVDHLLVQLSSNLAPLKYSIDFRRIQDLRQSLRQFGNVDAAIFDSYDQFASELDHIATEIDDPASDQLERARYVQHVIEDFEDEVRSLKADIRAAKTRVVETI